MKTNGQILMAALPRKFTPQIRVAAVAHLLVGRP